MREDISAIAGGTRNEVCEGVDWDEYLASPGLNPSTIVHGLKSLKHLKYAWDHPRADTDDLRWGRAVHCLVFEPRTFEDRYAYWEGRRAGNAYKAFAEECRESGKEVLPYDGKLGWISCQNAALAMVHSPKLAPYIQSGQPEVTLLTVEEGLQCRGRVDWVSTEGVLVDLKTTKNIDRRKFGVDFFAYDYDVKLGLYRRWLERLTGARYRVETAVVEKEPPYDTTVFPVPPPVLDRGAEKGLLVIQRVAEAIRHDAWPGVDGVEDYYLDVPPWEMEEELVGAEEA